MTNLLFDIIAPSNDELMRHFITILVARRVRNNIENRMSSGMSILKFGKHKGEDLTDIPMTYLKWLEEQDWILEELRREINHEINRREGDRPGAGFERKPRGKISIKGA